MCHLSPSLSLPAPLVSFARSGRVRGEEFAESRRSARFGRAEKREASGERRAARSQEARLAPLIERAQQAGRARLSGKCDYLVSKSFYRAEAAGRKSVSTFHRARNWAGRQVIVGEVSRRGVGLRGEPAPAGGPLEGGRQTIVPGPETPEARSQAAGGTHERHDKWARARQPVGAPSALERAH